MRIQCAQEVHKHKKTVQHRLRGTNV